VTHDLDSIYIADQVTYLEDGQLQELPMPMNR
jgi:ABC-type transport system involved in cytochrome bd biosynthesis fused ATPase/permease subunit